MDDMDGRTGQTINYWENNMSPGREMGEISPILLLKLHYQHM